MQLSGPEPHRESSRIPALGNPPTGTINTRGSCRLNQEHGTSPVTPPTRERERIPERNPVAGLRPILLAAVVSVNAVAAYSLSRHAETKRKNNIKVRRRHNAANRIATVRTCVPNRSFTGYRVRSFSFLNH